MIAAMSKTPLRVAVVDDDLSVRKALARLLVTAGFEAEAFGSARDFLRALRDHQFDCLIVDLHMPEASGLELQQHLRRNEIRIPTIVITAYNEANIRQRCEAAGAAFLLKPITESILVDAVQTAVAGHTNGVSPA